MSAEGQEREVQRKDEDKWLASCSSHCDGGGEEREQHTYT